MDNAGVLPSFNRLIRIGDALLQKLLGMKEYVATEIKSLMDLFAAIMSHIICYERIATLSKVSIGDNGDSGGVGTSSRVGL